MKKLVSLIMALVMVFTMAPAVFAEEGGSVVLLDETATTTDDYEASWGVPFETVAPGDGTITITFDDITEVVPEYRITVDGDDVSGWQNCLYDGLPTNTYMVAEGDSILVEVCTQVNGSYAPASIHFTLVYTPASDSAEQEIITGTASFDDSKSAYTGKTINYVPENDGTLTLNLYPHDDVGVEYKFEVNGYPYWGNTLDGSPLTYSEEVSRGDNVEILISTLAGFDNYVPGTVDYEIIFTPSEGGGEGGEEIDTVLEIGDNNLSISAGNQYSAYYTFTATEDGTLTITPTYLAAISFEGTTDLTEVINDFFGSAVVLYVDDEPYSGPVSVAAGETLTLYLYQNRMYANENYAWDAILNLAIGAPSEGGSAVPEIVTGSVTTTDPDDAWIGHEVYYTAPGKGTVTITLTSETSHVEYNINGDWFNTYNGEPNTQTYDVSAGDEFTVLICTLENPDSYIAATVNYEFKFLPEGAETVTGSVTTTDPDDAWNGHEVYYTAPGDGTVTIVFTSETSHVEYNINGSWFNTYNGDSNTQTYNVSAGDEFTVLICTLENPDSYVAATVNYEFIFVPSAGGSSENTVELFKGENVIIFPEDGSVSEINGVYNASADGVLTIDIPIYMSVCGDEVFEGTSPLDDFIITVNGEAVTSLPYSVEVSAGDAVDIYMKNLYADYGIGFEVLLNLTHELGEIAPTVLNDGENFIFIHDDASVASATAIYTATETGTLILDIPAIQSVLGEEVESIENIFEPLTITVNGVAVETLPYEIEVTEGDEVTVEFAKNWWAGIGFQLQLNVSYVLPEAEPTELWDGENFIELAEDERVESVNAYYTATETGTLVIDVPLYMSFCEGEDLYGENFLSDMTLTVNSLAVEALPYEIEVTEGETVYFEFIKNGWAGIGYAIQVDLGYALGEIEPTVLVDGENTVAISEDMRVESTTCLYTATKTGILTFDITDIVSVCAGEIENVDDIFDALTITVNGSAVDTLPYSVEVTEGDTVTVEFVKNWWTGIGFEANVTLAYEDGDEPSVVYGDVNGDGSVNVLDANLVRRAAAKIIDLDENQKVAADVNGDGSINVLDANLIRRFAAKIIDIFPVEE